MARRTKHFDLEGFCEAHEELREQWIAAQLNIKPARFSKLKSRKYGLRPTEEEIAAIAALLRQSAAHVRKLYERKAA